MVPSRETAEMPCLFEDEAERPFDPERLAHRRHSHFCRFLREELRSCRTETERKVVLSALLVALVQIRSVEGESKPQGSQVSL